MGGGGGVSDCLPWATPIGASPLLILTLCGSERVLVVSTEPPDDLSCLTAPGVGCPGDGPLPVPLTRGMGGGGGGRASLERGGGGGFWDPNVCVSKMAPPDFPNSTFRFSHDGQLVQGRGCLRTPPPSLPPTHPPTPVPQPRFGHGSGRSPDASRAQSGSRSPVRHVVVLAGYSAQAFPPSPYPQPHTFWSTALRAMKTAVEATVGAHCGEANLTHCGPPPTGVSLYLPLCPPRRRV